MMLQRRCVRLRGLLCNGINSYTGLGRCEVPRWCATAPVLPLPPMSRFAAATTADSAAPQRKGRWLGAAALIVVLPSPSSWPWPDPGPESDLHALLSVQLHGYRLRHTAEPLLPEQLPHVRTKAGPGRALPRRRRLL